MDENGRATDNALIKRLWRSVKYAKIYLFPLKPGQHLASLQRNTSNTVMKKEEIQVSKINDTSEVFFPFRPPSLIGGVA